MTEIFTFKTSRLSLIPILLWFAKLEIKFRIFFIRRKNEQLQKYFWEDLSRRVSDLNERLKTIWAHFKVPVKEILKLYEEVNDPSHEFIFSRPKFAFSLFFLHYKLTLEYRHYQRLLSIEASRRKRFIEVSDRFMPSWIKVVENVKKLNEEFDKEEWVNSWANKLNPWYGTWGSASGFIDAVVFVFFGGFILSLILTFYFYFMTFKDEIVNLIAKMMVDESIKYGMAFPKVYTSFGAAIIIIIFMPLTAFLLYRLSLPKGNLAKGLAEIAYKLEPENSDEEDIFPLP